MEALAISRFICLFIHLVAVALNNSSLCPSPLLSAQFNDSPALCVCVSLVSPSYICMLNALLCTHTELKMRVCDPRAMGSTGHRWDLTHAGVSLRV